MPVDGPRTTSGRRRAGPLRSLLACVVVSACSTLPRSIDKTPSTAFADTDGTRIARIVAAATPADASKSESGLQLVTRGQEAFGDLFTLIEHAERSIDLQYYIIKDDAYSHALLRAARRAAERGVRVRVLLDDFYTSGEDERIAWYSAQPNIDVRLFNPFAYARSWFATRLITSIVDLDRIDRRMHNKLFVVDNALAVTGGRNVGAEYYMHSDRTNFLDLDVIAGGPIVHELSDAFDRYWNSPFAVPIESLTKPVDPHAPTVDQRALADPNDPVLQTTVEAERSGAKLADELDHARLTLTWAPTALIVDQPSKVHRTAPLLGKRGLVSGATIASDILSIIATAQNELVIISPYFVPGKRGVAALRTLVERGVRVHVLTNSLAATDAAIVHIGYAHYRKQLLELGVEIDELRPDPGAENATLGAFGSSKASLHAKVLVVDRKTLFVGSFNVDQRSALENTEMGLEMQSPQLCDEVIGVLRDRGVESRYRVTLDRHGELLWTTRTNGVDQVFHDEPGASATLKWTLELLSPFAPEQLL
jgi:phosphatidylserine/phosphatidylglycerophosphate/cardiolipin synthase-like enzyme